MDGIAAVRDGDPAIAPAVATALPLPTTRIRVQPPLRQQPLDQPQPPSIEDVRLLGLVLLLNLGLADADRDVCLVHLRRLTITAVAAPYDDLFTGGEPLTEMLVDQLGEEALESLLFLRFRAFLACGHRETDALLLAVGYREADLAFVAAAGHGPALLLQ